MRDPETGNSKGFAFINFASFEASDASIEAMNGQYLCNRPISVSYAFKKDSKGERHGSAAERLLAAQNPLSQADRPHQLFADAPPMGMMPMSIAPPPPPVMLTGMMPPPPPTPASMHPPPPPPVPPQVPFLQEFHLHLYHPLSLPFLLVRHHPPPISAGTGAPQRPPPSSNASNFCPGRTTTYDATTSSMVQWCLLAGCLLHHLDLLDLGLLRLVHHRSLECFHHLHRLEVDHLLRIGGLLHLILLEQDCHFRQGGPHHRLLISKVSLLG